MRDPRAYGTRSPRGRRSPATGTYPWRRRGARAALVEEKPPLPTLVAPEPKRDGATRSLHALKLAQAQACSNRAVSTGADEVVRSGHLSTEERKAASHPKSLEADGRRPSLTLGGRCSEAAALPAVGRERSARWRQVHHPRGCAHGPLHLALSRAALRRRGWGHTASVCTCAMYLASSYAPQARGGQAVSSAVTAQSCLALRGRLPTDGLGPPKTQVCVAREARAARAKQPKCGCLTRVDGACRPQSRVAGASGRLGPPRGTGALTATSSRRAWPPAP